MGFFKFFKSRSEDSSASVAKERLQVLIAHERSGRNGPDYLPMLKQDILDVIKKYVAVDDDALSVQLDSNEDCDILELNITLPDAEPAAAGAGGGVVPSAEAKRRAELRRKAFNQVS
ncbi:MAG: cell division topological specificity factor MinE [Granulosicoccus sp.]|nr:cell division topological specificity factor MinE [Granulosicoccus sp.]